jgi:hypothetical protein
MFKWHEAVPAPPGADGVEQNINSVNLGMTYDF